MKKIYFLTLLLLGMQAARAQDAEGSADSNDPGNTKFLLTGYAYLDASVAFAGGESQSNIDESGFNSIFVWKKSDKLMFEGEYEVAAISSGYGKWATDVALEYASMNYKVSKYLSFQAGKFLSPIGTFQERLHPKWINKLASAPVGIGGATRMQPGTEIGFSARGGVPMGGAKLNYIVWLSNGPVLNANGSLGYKNLADNNKGKALGGRIGLLPFSNSSFEIGVSEYTATVGTDGDQYYDGIGANIFALDFNFVKQVPGLKGIIDIKGQYNALKVDDARYFTGPTDTQGYTFDNSSNTYYAQLAYRPTSATGFVKNLELVGRYAAVDFAETLGTDQNRLTLGLNYWLNWNSVVKLNFENIDVSGQSSEQALLVVVAFGL
ncbi:MAG: hypothetical protein EPO28_03310 [Saprospiraceae bacterium]|nr:MAG: hypothetical protein EPO28_03310 [Saprospiraceae bacterium]